MDADGNMRLAGVRMRIPLLVEWPANADTPPHPVALRRPPSPARGEGLIRQTYTQNVPSRHAMPSPFAGGGGMRSIPGEGAYPHSLASASANLATLMRGAHE
jgi:hypothetical protein